MIQAVKSDDDTKRGYVEEMQAMIEDKRQVHLPENIYCLTAICFLKETREHYLLYNNKQA